MVKQNQARRPRARVSALAGEVPVARRPPAAVVCEGRRGT